MIRDIDRLVEVDQGVEEEVEAEVGVEREVDQEVEVDLYLEEDHPLLPLQKKEEIKQGMRINSRG